MSIAKAHEGKSNASSFSGSEKRKTNADILELADDDDLFPTIDSSTETALRNNVNAIVEYLEETYEISVHALSVSFIRGAMHRELILLHVTSVAWDSPPRDERLESKQSSVHRLAAVSRELSRLRHKVAQLEARAEDDAAKLLGSDKALATAQAALQSAHKESQARESELRASLARQQSELNSIVAELSRARSQLELERKLRSKAEVDAQNAKHALTSLEVHREFMRKCED
ncbi:Hypothetical Protein FCC1311_104552 [Hondaea fermentalgiana]|uniref:Uncharacterized protein n=1 Tax=Hondaea fermentalgiana TaxID=2315210 RepID=A0A2R5H0F1_9STRA|nr:Hypothetical Protein FCC1311_104552 [Hondaea fermentalgiana]|eukprot:GBG34231.1 Hypothetical Protein FCC1311_104552 [Hondaea fermentalgiana]